jgi:hypothetical protein
MGPKGLGTPLLDPLTDPQQGFGGPSACLQSGLRARKCMKWLTSWPRQPHPVPPSPYGDIVAVVVVPTHAPAIKNQDTTWVTRVLVLVLSLPASPMLSDKTIPMVLSATRLRLLSRVIARRAPRCGTH